MKNIKCFLGFHTYYYRPARLEIKEDPKFKQFIPVYYRCCKECGSVWSKNMLPLQNGMRDGSAWDKLRKTEATVVNENKDEVLIVNLVRVR